MNKKVFALILVVALALCSLSAASTTGTSGKNELSLGVGLGTNSGVAVKYGMGKFDLQGNVGVKFVGGTQFSIDVGAFYNFYDIKFNTGTLSKTQTISLTAGPIAAFNVKKGSLAIDAILAVGAEYTWSKVPITMFLKLGGGADFKFENSSVSTKFVPYAVLGAVYTF